MFSEWMSEKLPAPHTYALPFVKLFAPWLEQKHPDQSGWDAGFHSEAFHPGVAF